MTTAAAAAIHFLIGFFAVVADAATAGTGTLKGSAGLNSAASTSSVSDSPRSSVSSLTSSRPLASTTAVTGGCETIGVEIRCGTATEDAAGGSTTAGGAITGGATGGGATAGGAGVGARTAEMYRDRKVSSATGAAT